jgi:protein-tyrosine phosphatase
MTILIGSLSANTDQSLLHWSNTRSDIHKFRSFTDISKKSDFSHIGIQGHYLSGSHQFSGKNISKLLGKVKQITDAFDKIIVVDLRMESHGFINDIPITWKVKNSDANLGKTSAEILQDERDRLIGIFENKVIGDIEVQNVYTEEEVVLKNKFEYVRLPTLDHSRPSDQVVDDYLDLIKNNRNNWLHVHCNAGMGRTTTFMVLYDMFYNSKDLEFEEILDRQKQIGGQDFTHYLTKANIKPRTLLLSTERLEFLKSFHKYCRESDPQYVSWQTWLQQQ